MAFMFWFSLSSPAFESWVFPHPLSLSRNILPGDLHDSRRTLEIWDVCGYRRTSDAFSDVAVGCQSSPSLHPYTLFTQQQHLYSAWGLGLGYLQSPACSPRSPRVLLIHCLYSGCKWQMVFLFWLRALLLGAFQPFSLSKEVGLITSTFCNWKPRRPAFILLKVSQFVGK